MCLRLPPGQTDVVTKVCMRIYGIYGILWYNMVAYMCVVCGLQLTQAHKYCDVRAVIKIVVIVVAARSPFHVLKWVSD